MGAGRDLARLVKGWSSPIDKKPRWPTGFTGSAFVLTTDPVLISIESEFESLDVRAIQDGISSDAREAGVAIFFVAFYVEISFCVSEVSEVGVS